MRTICVTLAIGLMYGCGRIDYDPLFAKSSTDGGIPGTDCQNYMSVIQAASDDGELYQTVPDPILAADGEGPGNIRMGCWDQPVLGYYRFQLPTALNAQRQVGNAQLELYGTPDVWPDATHFLGIHIEDSTSAAVVTKNTDGPLSPLGGRPLTTLNVRWPADGGLSWKVGVFNQSPDVASLINDLITRYGSLASGDYIQFWLWSPDCMAGILAEIGAEDRSANLGHESRLTLTVCQ